MLLGGQGREEGGGGDQAALLHPARLPQCIMQPVQTLGRALDEQDFHCLVILEEHVLA
jgi:hypothetical protein